MIQDENGIEQTGFQRLVDLNEQDPQGDVTVDIPIRGYQPGCQITAEEIKEKLTLIFRDKNLPFQIIKVEIRVQSDDQDEDNNQVIQLNEERQFNNIIDFEFLKNIIEPKQLMSRENYGFGEEQENQTQTGINKEFYYLILLESFLEIQEFLKIIMKGKIISHDVRNLLIDMDPDDKVFVNVHIHGKINRIFQFARNCQNDQYFFYNMKLIFDGSITMFFRPDQKIQPLPKEKQIDFNSKLRKKKVFIDYFQMGYYEQDFAHTKKDSQLEYNFCYYYDSRNLTDENKTSIYYYPEETRYHKKIEVFLDLKQYYLKIDISLEEIQSILSEELDYENRLWIKLMCPPQFQISKKNPKSNILPSLKENWTRVDNFILNQLQIQGEITDFERLHLINNTVFCFFYKEVLKIIRFFNKDLMITDLLDRIQKYCLSSQQEYQVKTQKEHSKISKFECSKKNIDNLPFGVKFNLLVLLSENRFCLQRHTDYMSQLIQFLQNQFQQENDVELFEAQFERTVQYFIKTTPNLHETNNFLRQMRKNMKLLQELMEQAQREIIYIDCEEGEDYLLAFIRRLVLSPSGFVFQAKEPEMTNKIIRQFSKQQDYFMRLNFQDENQKNLKKQQYICQQNYAQRLKKGINVQNKFKFNQLIFDRCYELFTWSASQLRAASTWLYDQRSARKTRQELIQELGNFRGLQSVSKFAARLGQQLSSSLSVRIGQVNVEETKDVIIDGKNFSDGIGMISEDLIQLIQRKLKIPSISAVQVRFGGAKGVLTLNKKLSKNNIFLRQSMIKFKPSKYPQYPDSLEILDYNKFRGGYLNRQIILLLSTLGVEDNSFIQLQDEYLQNLENISMIDASIYKYFNVDYNGEFQGLPSIIKILQDMINADINPQTNGFIQGVLSRLRNRGYLQLRTKSNILVDKAARLLGILDDYDILRENEIYAQYCQDDISVKSKPIIIEGVKNPVDEHNYVIVTRNPCLHPGDIRKVRSISDEEVRNRNGGENPFTVFTNCIIFPRKGQVLTAQMAGGDLDGDLYFSKKKYFQIFTVSWDERLMIKEAFEPFKYDDEQTKKVQQKSFKERKEEAQKLVDENHGNFTTDQMIDFMLKFITTETLGTIDNSHLAIADKDPQMAMCSKCLKLAEYHAKAVDSNKTGESVIVPTKYLAKEWPDFMEKENKLLVYESQSVLGKLYREICQIIKNLKIDDQNPNQKQYPLDQHTVYGFQNLLKLAQTEKISKIDLIKKFIQREYQEYFKQVANIIKLVNTMMTGLMKLYDIQDEYEIYSGNISSFIKGDAIHKKVKLDSEMVQKRLIQNLVHTKNELFRLTQKIKDQYQAGESTLKIISLTHLVISYNQKYHQYPENDLFGLFLVNFFSMFNEIISPELQLQQYTGFTWFFFWNDLINIKNKEKEFQNQSNLRQNFEENQQQVQVEQEENANNLQQNLEEDQLIQAEQQNEPVDINNEDKQQNLADFEMD